MREVKRTSTGASTSIAGIAPSRLGANDVRIVTWDCLAHHWPVAEARVPRSHDVHLTRRRIMVEDVILIYEDSRSCRSLAERAERKADEAQQAVPHRRGCSCVEMPSRLMNVTNVN